MAPLLRPRNSARGITKRTVMLVLTVMGMAWISLIRSLELVGRHLSNHRARTARFPVRKLHDGKRSNGSEPNQNS